MTAPTPNPRERALAAWAHRDEPLAARHALHLANYREELLRPFDEMLADYDALGDERVVEHLTRIIRTLRGEE